MRILPRKIRIRTAILIAMALMLTLSLFFVITFYSIRNSLIERSENEARVQLQSVLSEFQTQNDSLAREQVISQHSVTGESRLVYIVFERVHDSFRTIYLSKTRSDSGAIPQDIVQHMLEASGQTISYSSNGSEFRLISLTSGQLIAGVAMDMRFIGEAEESMESAFAYSLLLGLFIAVACGILVANFTLSPLSALVAAARSITGDKSEAHARLPVPTNVAEIGELAIAINSLLAARDASLEQMKHFTADAAHELRTPLTVLKGEIEVELRLLPAENPQRELLESNLEEVERLISIVQDLLYLATMEAEGDFQGLEMESGLLISVRRASERLNALAEEKKVSIVANFPERNIQANEERLVRLIYNLLLNAIQHSKPSGVVECLTVEFGDGSLAFSISDSGSGIPAAALDHIFDRFYRAGTSRSRKEGGAGLGLAIAKSIADHYGFGLTIESKVDVGTTVALLIPKESIER